MEVNPYEARLRLLQQMDGVQMQREAAPDEETAGCPGCPYFWTCPVPHRGEEVRAPAEIELEDVAEALGPRRAFRPRDESDVGWSDTWVDEEGLTVDAPEPSEEPDSDPEPTPVEEPADEPASVPARRGPRTWFRRRR